jgi:hypothetical protein
MSATTALQIAGNMELGGLEPPTSWVRSTRSAIEKTGHLQEIRAVSTSLQTAAIAGDVRRFSWCQALLAVSA